MGIRRWQIPALCWFRDGHFRFVFLVPHNASTSFPNGIFMNAIFIFVGATALYGGWLALVLLGKTDAHELVVAIGAGLAFLGRHVSKDGGASADAAADGGTGASANAPAAAAASASASLPPSAAPQVSAAAPQVSAAAPQAATLQ